MRKSIVASLAIVLALVVTSVGDLAAQSRQRINGEGFISEGIPKMPNPPGPAPKRDLSGAWIGPGASNKPDPAPPMTPSGRAIFNLRKSYGPATAQKTGESNDSFITCDPLGFALALGREPWRNAFRLCANRILVAFEQQRIWREIDESSGQLL